MDGPREKRERANLRVRAVRGRNFSICAAMLCERLFFYQVRERAYGTESFIEYLKDFLQKLE